MLRHGMLVLAGRRTATKVLASDVSPVAMERAEAACAQMQASSGFQSLRQLFRSAVPQSAANSHPAGSQGDAAAGPDEGGGAAQQPDPAAAAAGATEQQGGNGDANGTPPDLQAELDRQRATAEDLDTQVAELKDKLLRNLADMENLRERSARQIESNKQFAVQSFAKSLLDVADNLERAAAAVPAEALQPGDSFSAADVAKYLRTLLEGVQLTDKQLAEALKKQGIEKYQSLGEKFDPNKHSALFEMPDPSKEPGTVGVVTKNGYTLNGRVVRAADVGVIGQR